jgi:hypothetical protein
MTWFIAPDRSITRLPLQPPWPLYAGAAWPGQQAPFG